MIEIKNFSLRFPSKVLFDNLNIEFKNSYIYGIFGLNSVGKTSFFKAIYGMYKHEGVVCYNSNRIRKYNISFLETECYFYPGLTGGQYLEIFVSEHKQIFDFDALAGLLGLPLDENIDSYSTGMKKKICFLGIIKTNRDVYFLDEPFNGVDVESVEIMKGIINQVKKNNRTVFITSHITEHLISISDFYFVIDHPSNLKLRNIEEFKFYLNGLTAIIDEKIKKASFKR